MGMRGDVSGPRPVRNSSRRLDRGPTPTVGLTTPRRPRPSHPTPISMRLKMVILLALFGLGLAAPAAAQTRSEQESAAAEAAADWLRFIDAAEYRLSWEEASAIFREAVTADQWESAVGQVLGPTGAVTGRAVARVTHTMELPDAPPGNYVILEYTSTFENTKGVETVVLREETSGWKVVGYFVRPG